MKAKAALLPIAGVAVILGLLTAVCGSAIPGTTPGAQERATEQAQSATETQRTELPPDWLVTAAVETVIAGLTQSASGSPQALTPPTTPQATVPPVETSAEPPPTLAPTATQAPPPTQAPTSTQTPQPTIDFEPGDIPGPGVPVPTIPTDGPIQVSPRPPIVAYDFIENYCQATWSDPEALPCPSHVYGRGKLNRYNGGRREDGEYSTGQVLWTQPKPVSYGIIQGEYPAFVVQIGDHFKATVGCPSRSNNNCSAYIYIGYATASGPSFFHSWWEYFDSEVTEIDIDLSPYARQSLRFVLKVSALSQARDDDIYWYETYIER